MGETFKRVLAGLIIASIAICGLVIESANWIFPLLMVMMFGLMGLWEFYTLSDRGIEGGPFRKIGVFFSVLIVIAFYANFLSMMSAHGHELESPYDTFVKYFYPGNKNLGAGLLIALFISVCIAQLLLRPLDGAMYSVAVTIAGPLYTVVTTSHGLLIFGLPHGPAYLVYFLALPIAMDSGAYFAGRWFGRHNAGLKVSPKKTYEGYIGGTIFTIVVSVLWVWGWKTYAWGDVQDIQIHLVEAGFIGLAIAFLSIFGDLAESAFKRDARIKDSASTIPGHGGMLDLADAIYWSIPVGFYYLMFRELIGFSV